MNLAEGLYKSLKQKTSLQERADKLGMSLEKYTSLKLRVEEILEEISEDVDSKVIKYLEGRLAGTSSDFKLKVAPSDNKEVKTNVDDGSMEATMLTDNEPKTAQELLDLHNLDSKEWKVSQFWSKQKYGRWEVSALFKPLNPVVKQENKFLEYLEKIKFENPEPTRELSPIGKQEVSVVLPLQDLHFGKTDNEEISKLAIAACDDLLSKTSSIYHIKECVLVIGGDLLQVDTFNQTTTKGTIVEYADTPMNAYIEAFDCMADVIKTAYSRCENLKVVYIPGNHDRLSSFHLAHALSKAFTIWKGITFDIEYAERKVHVYNKNLYCFEHGDVKSKETPLVYAVEFPELWGKTVNRTLYQGHYHHNSTTEQQGFVTRIMPSLCSTDYFHYKHKMSTSRRSAIIEIHDAEQGKIGEFTYNVK